MKLSSRLPQFSVVGIAACLGIVALPTTAQAQTLIYDNGTITGGDNGLNITAFAIADDFVFDSTQTFDQVRVWIFDNTLPNNTLNAFSGTLSWLIRSNNAGIPGAVLGGNSGTVSGAAITQTDTGVDVLAGYRVFQFDFSIPSTTLGAGTYWFQIREGNLGTFGDTSHVFWLDTGNINTGFAPKADNNVRTPTTWSFPTGPKPNRAFQFLGPSNVTPELPGLALVVPALLPVALVALRRRRSKASA